MRLFLVGILVFVESLSAQITIEGTVTRAGSPATPVADALVEFTRLDPGASDTLRSVLGSVRTDQTGRYSFNYTTGVGQEESARDAVPRSFTLSEAYPNPFNSAGTQMDLGVGRTEEYSVTIYNILGQKLAEVRQHLTAGSTYALHWEGARAPGVYFASIRGGGTTSVVKLIQSSARRSAPLALRLTPGARAGQSTKGAQQDALGKTSDLNAASASSLIQITVTRAGYQSYASAPLAFASQSADLAMNYLGSIFSARRDSSLRRSGARFTELLKGTTRPDAARAMSEWLKAQTEVEETGAAADGNAWARYSDGSIVIFVNNLDPIDTSAAPPAGMMARPPKVRPGVFEKALGVPGANVFVAANSFGSVFGEGAYYSKRLAEEAGYTGTWAASVDELKGVGALKPGIFFAAGHGGYGTVPGGGSEYAIWTSTERTARLDSIYADDLREHRLVWMYALYDQWASSAKPDSLVQLYQEHYAFTGQFVRKYMEFEKNSLVYIAGCSSATNNVFVNSFFAKGATVFAGYNNTAYADLIPFNAMVFFDRTLGSSADYVIPEEPPQRAFDWPEVKAWMQSKNYDRGSQDGSTRLVLVSASGTEKPAQPLAPSIATMFVHPYDEKLYIYGNFGENPGSDGTVTVGGVPMEVYEWGKDSQAQMDKIICRIPDEGAGSYGDVEVSVRKIKSNKTQLSRYKGIFKLVHETTDGRQYEVKLTLQFRVHLLGFRMKPGEAPVFNQPTYVVNADMGSTGESTASGTTAGAISWSGHVTDLHNNIDGAASPKSFIAGAWFDPEKHTMQLYLSGGVENGIIQTAGTQSVPMSLIFGTDDFSGKKENFPSYAEITLNPDFSIPKGSCQASKVSMYFSMMQPFADKVRIEWDDIACEAKPDPKAKR